MKSTDHLHEDKTPSRQGREKDSDISFRLKEKEAYIGITVDELDEILYGEEVIGKIGITEYDNSRMFIEWIELEKSWQGKHLMRKILAAFAKKHSTFYFFSNEDHLPMYLHLGARILEYDDFREMYEMSLSY